MRGIAAMGVLLALAGCAGGPGQPVRFSCADGGTLLVTFRPAQDAVEVRFRDQTRTLPRIQSADGARFGDAAMQVWTVGPEATVSLTGGPTVACQQSRGML